MAAAAAAAAAPVFVYQTNVPLCRVGGGEHIGESPHHRKLPPPHDQAGPLGPRSAADGRLRLVFASDFHNEFCEWVAACHALPAPPSLDAAAALLPPGDVLIVTGDFTDVGDDDEVDAFLDFLAAVRRQQRYDDVVLIAGNHELSFDPHRATATGRATKARFLQRIAELGRVVYLEDSAAVVAGLKFYGTPWTPTAMTLGFVPKGPPKAVRDFLADKWRHIPDDVDVLLTHVPPDGLPGFGSHRYFCQQLTDRLAQINPLVHCFGHVHDRRAVVHRWRIDPASGQPTHSTWLVLAATKARSYFHPIVLDLQPSKLN